jgi:hypothetical protein
MMFAWACMGSEACTQVYFQATRYSHAAASWHHQQYVFSSSPSYFHFTHATLEAHTNFKLSHHTIVFTCCTIGSATASSRMQSAVEVYVGAVPQLHLWPHYQDNGVLKSRRMHIVQGGQPYPKINI